jgi:hypothetical protein
MPKPRAEETKKHGDPLEPLIDSARGTLPRERNPDDEPDELEAEDDEDGQSIESDDVEE